MNERDERYVDALECKARKLEEGLTRLVEIWKDRDNPSNAEGWWDKCLKREFEMAESLLE